MKRRLLLVAGLLWALTARGQTYFNSRYTLAADASGATTLATNGSGFVLATQTFASPTAIGALTLTFVDSAGRLLPPRPTYSGPSEFYPGLSLLRCPDGGLALPVGVTDSTDTGFGQLWRFNAQGDTLWTRTYGLPGAPSPSGLLIYNACQLADGGFMLTGMVQHAPGSIVSYYDVFVLRTDAAGHERWRRSIPIGGNDRSAGFNVLVTADGGCLVTGYTYYRHLAVPENSDGLVLKLDSTGTEQWRRIFGGPYMDQAGPALVTPDGGYLVSGAWTDQLIGLHSQSRPTLLKLDSAGQVQWRRSYGPATYGTGPNSFHRLPDGSLLMAGQTGDTLPTGTPGFTEPVGFFLKLCTNGDSLWYRTYKYLLGPQSQNYLRGVVPTADGGFAATGFLWPQPPDTGTEDVWLFKTDVNGYLQPGGAPPTTTCVLGVEQEAPVEEEAVSIFPNPSAGGRFTVWVEQAPVSLKVTDALGRAVLTASYEPRTANLELDLSRQPAGVYALRVTWPDGRTVTRRLVK